MSAIDKCISRLIFLEGEVKTLRAKVEDDLKWKRRMEVMEKWLGSRFDYNPNDKTGGNLGTIIAGEKINLASTSTKQPATTSSVSMTSSKYWERKGTTLSISSSGVPTTTTKRNTRSSTESDHKKISEYSHPKQSNSRSRVDFTSISKGQRHFISDSVEIQATSADVDELDEEEDGGGIEDDEASWSGPNTDEIKIEEMQPSFELEPEGVVEEEEEGTNGFSGEVGGEWEIYNSDEEQNDNKFQVIGYDSDDIVENETNYYPGYVPDDSSSFSEVEEPNVSVTTSRSNASQSRLSLLKTSFVNQPSKPKTLNVNTGQPSFNRFASSAAQNNLDRSKITISAVVQNKKKTGGLKSTSRLQMNLNNLLQQNVKKPNCGYCGKPFNTTAELMRHQRIHVGDKPFSCYVCEYSTSFNGDLVRHLKSRHPGYDAYVCHICSFRCKEHVSLTEHRRKTGHGGRGANKRLHASQTPL